MKHLAIRLLCVVALIAGVTGAASAQGRPCPSVKGEWAFTKTGTLLLPVPGPLPYAAVGRIAIASDLTISGSQDSSTGGAVARNLLAGSIELDADCAATAIVLVYDAEGVNLLRTAVMRLIVDDNASEFRGIVTQLTLPNGYVVPQAVTSSGRKVLNSRGQ